MSGPEIEVTFEPVDPLGPLARASLLEYFDELDRRFPAGFDPGDASRENAQLLGPPTGVFLLARYDDEVVGCGGVQRIDDTTAEIKRMWVRRDWRGLGVGRRLLTRLEASAKDLGYRRVQLDTNSTLTEARVMYVSAGYDEIDRYNDNPHAFHWFAKEL